MTHRLAATTTTDPVSPLCLERPRSQMMPVPWSLRKALSVWFGSCLAVDRITCDLDFQSFGFIFLEGSMRRYTDRTLKVSPFPSRTQEVRVRTFFSLHSNNAYSQPPNGRDFYFYSPAVLSVSGGIFFDPFITSIQYARRYFKKYLLYVLGRFLLISREYCSRDTTATVYDVSSLALYSL